MNAQISALRFCSVLLLLAGNAVAQQSTPSAGTPSAREERIELPTPTGVIHGTLLLPSSGDAPFPMALIIAGSGPTDRDGNSAGLAGPNNSLKLLAEGLALQGIASVRYDKRGVAASTSAATSEAALRFETYIDDAASWIALLRTDARFSTITIVGHSEGSLIGMVATRKAHADAFVSIAGTGRPAALVLREQLGRNLPPPLLQQAEEIITKLEAGLLPDSVPAPLNVLFRRSVQPYLSSWFKYDPAGELAQLRVPVLIAQGTTDIQVPLSDAQLLAAALPAADTITLEGMNHVLKQVSGDLQQQLPSYVNPMLPVVPRLIERVGAFIRANRRRAEEGNRIRISAVPAPHA